MLLASSRWAMAAALRRLVGRRRRPTWSLGYEVLVAAQRGAWSVMTEIGLVRWRNVSEAMARTRMDGLEPKLVREQGACNVEGVWLEPPEAGNAVMLYVHGGAFAFGSLQTHGDVIGAVARAARARTLAIEYRLAPEHPAPAALEDVRSAYQYLLARGIPPDRIVLAGDSAGGALVVLTLLALRDAGATLPAAAVAICPWVDLACSGDSFETNSPFDFVALGQCRLAAASYLAGADPRRPDRSPLYADLSGLPPLLVQAGEAEVLFDQVCAFAARARDAGVLTRLSRYSDMVHVWHLMRGATADAQRAIDEIGDFVRESVALV